MVTKRIVCIGDSANLYVITFSTKPALKNNNVWSHRNAAPTTLFNVKLATIQKLNGNFAGRFSTNQASFVNKSQSGIKPFGVIHHSG